MTAWTQLIGDSGILERLGELGPALDLARARTDNAPEDLDGIERIRAVLTFIGKRLDGADSNLLSAIGLESVAASVSEATTHVTNFAGDGAQGHLASANDSVDAALVLFARLVLPTKTTDLRGLREAADSYRESMSANLAQFATDVGELGGKANGLSILLVNLRKEFDSAKAVFDEEVETFKGEVAATQTELKASHDAAEKRFADGAETAFAQWASDFTAAEVARKETHEARSAEADEAFSKMTTGYDDELKATSEATAAQLKAALASHDNELTALKESYVDRAETVLKTIEANLARVQELVGVIGDHGVTSGFKKAADDSLSEVVYWQRVTFWSMVLLILFTGYTGITLHGADVNWFDVARRVIFTATVGALATYAASQTSRYQIAERKNRKLELELRALGPFLESVTPEQQEKFRLKIAEVFFGKEEPTNHDKPGPATALHASKETFDKLLDVAKALVEKK